MRFELLLASLVAGAWLAPQAPTAGAGLVRVRPQGAPNPPVLPILPQAEPFDAAAWRERLTAPDLDARMFAFEQLAQRAGGDRQVREQLEEWSRAGDELAWTSRLLLRDGSRTQRRAAGAAGGLWRVDPLDEEPWGDLERRLEDLWQLHGGASGLWTVPWQGGSRSAQSSQVEITPDGVKVRITEEVDGQPTTREFSAATLDELLEAHPELRGRVGVQRGPTRGPSFGPRFDWFLRGPERDFAPDVAPSPSAAVRTDVLGVVLEELQPELRQQLGIADGAGLRIVRVEAGTIAQQLGLKPGHVLVELDGAAVRTRDDVSQRIRAREKDAEVRAVYLDRWGQRHEARWRQQSWREI